MTLYLSFWKLLKVSEFSKKLSYKFVNCSAPVKIYTERDKVSLFWIFLSFPE